MFALPSCGRNDFYTPVPRGWENESNRSLRVLTPMMILYSVDHLRMSGLKVWEHLGRIVEVASELTTVVGFIITARHGVISRLAPDDMTRVCSKGGVLIRGAQGIIPKWFGLGLF